MSNSQDIKIERNTENVASVYMYMLRYIFIWHAYFHYIKEDGLPNYTGTVEDIPNSIVHGYFRDGTVFDGTIYADDDIYYIEHATK